MKQTLETTSAIFALLLLAHFLLLLKIHNAMIETGLIKVPFTNTYTSKFASLCRDVKASVVQW